MHTHIQTHTHKHTHTHTHTKAHTCTRTQSYPNTPTQFVSPLQYCNHCSCLSVCLKEVLAKPHVSHKAKATAGGTGKDSTFLHFLKSAFRERPSPGRSHPSHALGVPARVSYQDLYQVLNMLNKDRDLEDWLYADYWEEFHQSKPRRHQDRRLIQALTDILTDEQY